MGWREYFNQISCPLSPSYTTAPLHSGTAPPHSTVHTPPPPPPPPPPPSPPPPPLPSPPPPPPPPPPHMLMAPPPPLLSLSALLLLLLAASASNAAAKPVRTQSLLATPLSPDRSSAPSVLARDDDKDVFAGNLAAAEDAAASTVSF